MDRSKRKTNLYTKKNLSQQVTDYKTYRLKPLEWMKLTAIAMFVTGVLAYVFYRNIIAWFIMLPLVFLYPFFKKHDLMIARKRKLTAQFKEAIIILAGSLSAGYSMENAMKESIEELTLLYGRNGVIVSEFEYIYHRVCMNIPIEKAFEEFAQRSGVDDIKVFSDVLKVAKRSGGELVGIINHTANTIGDKIRMQEEILTMTAAKRFEQSIMNLIPILIVIYIDVTSPGFFMLMYTMTLGKVIMTVCLCAYIIAILIAKRILQIEI